MSRAREVSLRDGNIRAVLSGRIARVGVAYVLTTEVVDPSDGSIHEVVEVDVAEQGALLSAVREQAFRVRETLGESLPALERSRQELARVTTPRSRRCNCTRGPRRCSRVRRGSLATMP